MSTVSHASERNKGKPLINMLQNPKFQAMICH